MKKCTGGLPNPPLLREERASKVGAGIFRFQLAAPGIGIEGGCMDFQIPARMKKCTGGLPNPPLLREERASKVGAGIFKSQHG